MNDVTVALKGSLFIGGRFHPGQGKAFASHYPATGQVVAQLHEANEADIEAAMTAAKAGLAVWRNTPLAQRARVLNRAAAILRARNDELARIETLDTGKVLQETLAVDIASGADALEYFAAQAATLEGEYVGFSGDGGDWGYIRREPLGVCVGIGAWNYPMQIACWKSAPALACGNAMVFKPAELTPLSALFLAEVYKEAGLPDGVFNVVQGDGAVGAALVRHPLVAKASLTGESSTGSKIMQGASEDIKAVTLELGGKSPMLVFEDADLDNAVSGALLANFYSTGQVCSNGTRVYVHAAVADAFIDKLVARTAKIKLGDPLDLDSQMGPLVSGELYDKVCRYLELGRSEAKVLLDGGPVSVPGFEQGHWISPTIWECDNDQARIAREEIFGPALTLMRFKDEAQVIESANDTLYGLSAAVFTRDLERAHRVIGQLQAGTCWINQYNITPIELPFGGYKRSGLGRENGRAALEHYSQPKSVYVAMSPIDAPY